MQPASNSAFIIAAQQYLSYHVYLNRIKKWNALKKELHSKIEIVCMYINMYDKILTLFIAISYLPFVPSLYTDIYIPKFVIFIYLCL